MDRCTLKLAFQNVAPREPWDVGGRVGETGASTGDRSASMTAAVDTRCGTGHEAAQRGSRLSLPAASNLILTQRALFKIL